MPELRVPVSVEDHHIGNVNAVITVVEYGDFECPYCRRAHPLVKRLLKEVGNELDFVFRNFPLRKSHPHAFIAAATAEAAGKQGKYWEMHDLIFENQEFLNENYLITLVESIRLNLEKFVKDSESEEIRTKIESDFRGGIRSGVNGTPTFFLNGSPILTYNETYESLLDAVLIGSSSKAK